MAVDTTSQRTRRAILFGAMGAAVASVAATVGRASPMSATDGDPILVGHAYSATGTTEIDSNGNGDVAFAASSASGGTGLAGSSASGVGVEGSSTSGIGVYADSGATDNPALYGHSRGNSTGIEGYSGQAIYTPTSPANTGVYGRADQPHGVGVYGQTIDTTAETYGVYGRVSAALGRAVFGWSLNETSGGTGAWGQSSSGTGVGVRGYAWDGNGASGQFGTGVMGTSGSHAFPPPKPLANVGVYGIGFNGRGVVAQGDKAQLRLVPSAAATHPAKGALGDLFLDQSGRLWLCKGTATWVLLG